MRFCVLILVLISTPAFGQSVQLQLTLRKSIGSYTEETPAYGTAFPIAANEDRTLLLTARHNLFNASKIIARDAGGRDHVATVFAVCGDRTADVALLSIPAKLRPLKLASWQPRIGEPVSLNAWLMGWTRPREYGRGRVTLPPTPPSAPPGSKSVSHPILLDVDSHVEKGCSGGYVMRNGEVVAVIVADTQSGAMAVRSTVALRWLRDLEAKRVARFPSRSSR